VRPYARGPGRDEEPELLVKGAGRGIEPTRPGALLGAKRVFFVRTSGPLPVKNIPGLKSGAGPIGGHLVDVTKPSATDTVGTRTNEESPHDGPSPLCAQQYL
jgi:hypothetical protein